MTEQQLLSEYTKKAKTAGLTIDCLGAGNMESEVCIISEAPGKMEKAMKMPFSGPSGRYLWDCLRDLGINRTNCYVTNVCKRELTIGETKSNRSPVPKTELEHWEGLLEWELDQLPNVKYVVILGNLALQAIIGDTKITNWRGSVVDAVVGRLRRPVKAIINYNPAHILRRVALEPVYKFDMAKIKLVMDGKYKPHIIKAHINPTYKEALEWIEYFQQTKKPIAFDIEVLSNETACVGFADEGHTGYCINLRDRKTNRFSLEEDVKIYLQLQRLFQTTGKRFIAQSGNFDSYWLGYKDRINVPNIWFDTLLAHHTLYPSLPHNLGFLTSQYTTHPYYKDEGVKWKEGGDIDQFWEYNVKDAAITWAVHDKLLKELKDQKLDKFYFNHVVHLTPHLVRMTVAGVKADTSLKDKIVDDMQKDLDKLEEDFNEACRNCTGESQLVVNPRSTKQLSELFYTKLGLVGRGTSTNKANRQRMLDHPRTSPGAIKMLRILDEYKIEHKFHSTYATMQVDDDHRIRCEWKQFGVVEAPGRLSSSQVMWGSGTNLQNQPERAYPMYITEDGYEFTYFDLSQAEARIVAYQWNVRALIENFELAADGSTDVHRLNAARIFQCDYDDIPTSDRTEHGTPTKRYLGKRCVHGLNYRMQAPKLGEVCGIPLTQAQEAYSSYHQAFPEIQRAWEDTVRTVRKDRMLFTPLGRRLIFLERITEEGMDSIIAFIPQATIGDKVSSVIYKCHEDKRWPSTALVKLNIHDALIAEHEIKDREIVTKIMKEHAEEPIMVRGVPVVIPTEFKHSVAGEDGVHRWSTLK
tara:strand:- start:4640 stop:7063 length:2424 start_codon:yes stop_codon:yes gene_type:complete